MLWDILSRKKKIYHRVQICIHLLKKKYCDHPFIGFAVICECKNILNLYIYKSRRFAALIFYSLQSHISCGCGRGWGVVYEWMGVFARNQAFLLSFLIYLFIHYFYYTSLIHSVSWKQLTLELHIRFCIAQKISRQAR